jgi:hypothetical protein
MSEEIKKPTFALVPNDPFDPASLRIGQDFVTKFGVTKLLTTVPVGKPHRQQWFRTHPDPEYRLAVAIIQVKDDDEYYVVPAMIARQLPNTMYYLATLQVAITRQGTVFLWVLRHSNSDGKDMACWSSARDASVIAQTKWSNITWNKETKAYDISEAPVTMPEPEWPPYTLKQLMEKAFKDKLIDSVDHPVIQRLQGRA